MWSRHVRVRGVYHCAGTAGLRVVRCRFINHSCEQGENGSNIYRPSDRPSRFGSNTARRFGLFPATASASDITYRLRLQNRRRSIRRLGIIPKMPSDFSV